MTHQTSALGLRAEEVHEDDIESGRNYQDKEEFPTNLVKGNGTSNEKNDICEIQARHSNAHTLASNMSREDLRSKIQVRNRGK